MFRVHALQQMAERRISREEVLAVVEHGDVVEAVQRKGRPFPTRVLLSGQANELLHVVVADEPAGTTYVVTAYRPTTERWKPGFRDRKER